jgi:hypothetical protein
MKFSFDGITIDGFGATQYHLTDFAGFDTEVDNIMVRVPRSDYSTYVSDFADTKIRTLTFELLEVDQTQFRTIKRAMMNRITVPLTFTITDDYKDSNNTLQTFATYEFQGKIISVQDRHNYAQNKSIMQLQIASEDPTISILPESDSTLSITLGAFGFPFGFPFGFVGAENILTVNNTGDVPVFPTITLVGPGVNWSINVTTAIQEDKLFTYSATLLAGERAIITPFPWDPVKIRKNGVSVVSDTNFNFDPLVLNPGINTLVFQVESSVSAATEANITFKPGTRGI